MNKLVQFESVIVRSGPPHKYDQAPYGTYCKVIILPDEYALYIQDSKDEENPRWEYLETFKNT